MLLFCGTQGSFFLLVTPLHGVVLPPFIFPFFPYSGDEDSEKIPPDFAVLFNYLRYDRFFFLLLGPSFLPFAWHSGVDYFPDGDKPSSPPPFLSLRQSSSFFFFALSSRFLSYLALFLILRVRVLRADLPYHDNSL